MFTNAVLFTPARTNTEDRIFKFAPLLVIETTATNAAAMAAADRPGCLERTNGRVWVNPFRPVVYAQRQSATWRGERLERFSYVWWYAADPTSKPMAPISAQGIRITATPSGQPLLFEVLRGPETSAVVVVSQSLEVAALEEFRRPLRGRQFAVELPADVPSAAVVARVIDDGPLELGPVVYLRRDRRTIGTVICRCMPAQVRNIADTGYYDLVAWPDHNASDLLEQAKKGSLLTPAWWPAPGDDAGDLDLGLRLPARLPGLRTVP